MGEFCYNTLMTSHNFINKHTAFAVLLLVVMCFFAGYFVGKRNAYDTSSYSFDDQPMTENY